jgi:single-stranded-DNA-specific exonuclease
MRSMAGDPFGEGRAWLERHGDLAVVVPHNDADGLSAGVLLGRSTGGGVLHVESPWDPPLRTEEPSVIADWGVRDLARDDVLFVDHHAAPEPTSAPVVHAEKTGDGSTSTLAWRLVGEPPDGAWLAALGLVGDLGAGALADSGLPAVPGRSKLAELASLVSAPGRIKHGPVEEAYDLLRDSDGIADALASPGLSSLREAKAEVSAELARTRKTAPMVGPVAALLRFDSPAKVHGQVAAAWSRRLAPRVVIAANEGWRDDKVSFSVRGGEGDLRAWLEGLFEPGPDDGDYARGHARATGGSLKRDAFERFARTVLETTTTPG